MRPFNSVLVLGLLPSLVVGCVDHRSGAKRQPAVVHDSVTAPAQPVTRRNPQTGGAPGLVTARFEDEVARAPHPPARTAGGEPDANIPQSTDRIAASLRSQLAERGGIQWDPSRPLQWSDFRAPAQPQGREAALSEVGQISGSGCDGSQFEYGVIAAFIPSESWVRPEVAANPMQSAIALAHEQIHFNISEIISRELRRTLATVVHPCQLSDADRDALGAAAFNEERNTQQRYDDETAHGLNSAAQQRWAAWAAQMLASLSAHAAPFASRKN
jgi:hypothetical protein